MNIVRSLQRRREIKKISQAVESEPTPRGYENLCERILSLKGAEEALPILEEAQARFPWSERLVVLGMRVRRAAVREELARLEADTMTSPTPEAYGRLAERLRQIGDEDEAIRICRDCAARFPQNENAFLVEGRLRVARFRRTGLPRDGLQAVEQLERAVVLNPENMRARRLLAELYAEIGASHHARAHLDWIVEGSGADPTLATLTERIQETAHSGSAATEDLATLFSTNGTGRRETRSPVLEGLIEELRTFDGVEEVIQFGLTSVSRDEGEAPADLDGLAAFVATLAGDSLLEMDMGNLRHGQLSGPWGHVLFFCFGKRLVALRGDDSMNLATVRERVLSVPVSTLGG